MSKSLLVVEDDENVQRFLTDLLLEEGFHVVCEKDGEWALRAIERRAFDLVILDVVLPGRNGFEVAEEMRGMRNGAEVPLLMISGIYRGARHRSEAMTRYGAVEYLDKPISIDRLTEVLRQVFGDAYPDPSDRSRVRRAIDRATSGDKLADTASKDERREVETAARDDFKGGKVARGDLSHSPFAEVLAQLYRWRSTGALLLKRHKVKKIVFFKDGYPSYVKSNVLAECLGKVMVRERLITAAECEESLALMKTKKRQQGTVLIEMGCISPHNLVYALELQLQTKLFDLFNWVEGDYQFNPKAAPPSEIVELGMTPATIIYEGIKRTHDVVRLRKLLADHTDSFLVVHSDPLQRFQEVDLSTAERRLVALIDGKKTLKNILEKQLLPEDRCLPLIYALIAAQMVRPEVKSAPKRDRIETTGMINKIVEPASPPPSPAKAPARGSAAPAPSPQPTREHAEREELARKAKEMRKMTYYEMLGVARTASAEEIKKAYYALTREYHPDRHYATAAADVRALADQIYSMIHTAHEVLSSTADREAYDSDLLTGLKKGAVDEVSRILAAESKFQRGEALMKKRQYDKAVDAFREALELYSDEGEFHAHLGWSLFQTDPNNAATQRQAEDHIQRGIELNPKIDKAYLFLGYLYKATTRRDEAEGQFEKAIQCNPDCVEALRELRLLEQNRVREQKGGLFTDKAT
ncbi:MAG: response regulator [Pseudomonadota bacterium]